jgi:hypothetical protein
MFEVVCAVSKLLQYLANKIETHLSGVYLRTLSVAQIM